MKTATSIKLATFSFQKAEVGCPEPQQKITIWTERGEKRISGVDGTSPCEAGGKSSGGADGESPGEGDGKSSGEDGKSSDEGAEVQVGRTEELRREGR